MLNPGSASRAVLLRSLCASRLPYTNNLRTLWFKHEYAARRYLHALIRQGHRTARQRAPANQTVRWIERGWGRMPHQHKTSGRLKRSIIYMPPARIPGIGFTAVIAATAPYASFMEHGVKNVGNPQMWQDIVTGYLQPRIVRGFFPSGMSPKQVASRADEVSQHLHEDRFFVVHPSRAKRGLKRSGARYDYTPDAEGNTPFYPKPMLMSRLPRIIKLSRIIRPAGRCRGATRHIAYIGIWHPPVRPRHFMYAAKVDMLKKSTPYFKQLYVSRLMRI